MKNPNILTLFASIALVFVFNAINARRSKKWSINTSNQGKLKEFERLFASHGISLKSTQYDLREIDADPLTVVVHKASQLNEGVLVEDTSLDIEGADVGVNVRWLIDNLNVYVGRKATCRVLLAYQKEGKIHVFEGRISGKIVEKQGANGFGFDPFFLPDNASETLAQSKPDRFNARAKAVESLLTGNPIAIRAPLLDWNGPWQKNN